MSCPVVFIQKFLDPVASTRNFHYFRDKLAWVQRENTPRKEYWTNKLDREYTYGKREGARTYQAQEPDDLINRINKHILKTVSITSTDDHRTFEGCFLNLYETGKDALGWHADDDPGIDHSWPIAIVSLYDQEDVTPRVISFREVLFSGSETEKAVFGATETMELTNGSLLLMKPGMQFTHQHKIPKAGFVCRPRISLTYRALLKN